MPVEQLPVGLGEVELSILRAGIVPDLGRREQLGFCNPGQRRRAEQCASRRVRWMFKICCATVTNASATDRGLCREAKSLPQISAMVETSLYVLLGSI